MEVTIPLGLALLQASCGLTREHRSSRPTYAPLFGLAPGRVCLATYVTVSAVGSYPTVSPLPPARFDSSGWRFVFCCTFRHPIRDFSRFRCLAVSQYLANGARTFLPRYPHLSHKSKSSEYHQRSPVYCKLSKISKPLKPCSRSKLLRLTKQGRKVGDDNSGRNGTEAPS